MRAFMCVFHLVPHCNDPCGMHAMSQVVKHRLGMKAGVINHYVTIIKEDRTTCLNLSPNCHSVLL